MSTRDCSGPFGEEAPGNWSSADSTLKKYRRILTELRYFGADGRLYGTFLHRAYKRLRGEPLGRYAFHARLGGR